MICQSHYLLIIILLYAIPNEEHALRIGLQFRFDDRVAVI